MVSSSTLTYTPVEEVATIVHEVEAVFKSRKTQSIEFRKEQIKQLWRLLDEHNDDILKALNEDSGKLPIEGLVFDLSSVKAEILHFLEKLDEWLAPEVVEVPSPYEHWQ
jgi:acyl-CoA reductase-like NAD-dependent aldehyde dehydrogenase